MIKKYFWREKNADKSAEKGIVFKPAKDELEKELILKLWQKLDRTNLIFDKKARYDYWEHDEKPKNFHLEDFTEKDLQKKIGMNVVVDFLQLVNDLCKFYDVKIIEPEFIKLNFKNIQKKLKENIEKLSLKENIEKCIIDIYILTLSLILLLNLNLEQVEIKRLEKEEKQGSFYNGKYVLVDLNDRE